MISNSPEAWSTRALDCATSHGAALWSEHGQTQRFLAARRALDLMTGDRVLDFGCGTARFCEFLPRDVSYFGLDSSSEMRERARREHPRAIVIDELTEIDAFSHVVAIGPFNLPDGWSYEQTWETLEALFSIAEQSLIVSLYRGKDPSCLSYDVDDLARFASTLSSTFVVDASYLPNDVLLVVKP